MQTLQVSIDIDRPPDVVFPYVARPENQKRWVATIIDSGQSPPPDIHVGDQFQIMVGSGGSEMQAAGEVVAYQPNHQLKISVKTDMYFASYAFTVEPNGGGSHVTYTTESEIYSPVVNLMMGLMGWLFAPLSRRSLGGELKKLKKMVERETS